MKDRSQSWIVRNWRGVRMMRAGLRTREAGRIIEFEFVSSSAEVARQMGVLGICSILGILPRRQCEEGQVADGGGCNHWLQ